MAIAASAIPGLLAALAIVYAVRHTQRPVVQERRPLRIRVRPVLTGRLRGLFAGITAVEFGNCAATLLILRATELFEPGRSTRAATAAALVLYVLYNLAATVTSLAAGRHTDRAGATRVLIIGATAFAAAYLGFTHDTTTWVALLPWFVLAGVGIGCVETAEHAAVATHASVDLRGSAFGLLATIQSLGNLAASGIAGIMWTALSPTWAFGYLATWMGVSIIGLSVGTRATGPADGLPNSELGAGSSPRRDLPATTEPGVRAASLFGRMGATFIPGTRLRSTGTTATGFRACYSGSRWSAR